MKLSVIFFIYCITLVLAKGELTKEEEEKILDDYLSEFKIRIGRSSSIDRIKKRVIEQYKNIEEHNERFRKGQETSQQKLNEFSYMTEEEFAATMLGYKEPENAKFEENETLYDNIIRSSRNALPTYLNWAENGTVVQPVQNQGSCGSCYAFAAVGVIEGTRCRYHKLCDKLSEQEVMECVAGCNGAWEDVTFDAIMRLGGCTLKSVYPYYQRVVNSCSAASSRPRAPNSKVSMYRRLPRNPEEIRTFLNAYGPLFVVYKVYSNFYNYYSGIYSSYSGNFLGTHAVLLVGYGTQNGVDYWILKNSWGATWGGEKGYFRMRRGIDLCGIESIRVAYAWTT